MLGPAISFGRRAGGRVERGVTVGLASGIGRRAVAAAIALALSAGAAQAASTEAVSAAGGQSVGSETKLPLPRYVSLNAPKINLRRGPGLEYRVDLEYRAKGLPVRVIDEYGHWRRIVDSDDEEGWVYHALLSGRRTVRVEVEGVLLRTRPVGLSEPRDCATLAVLPKGATGCAEQGAVLRLLACERFWCRIEAGRVVGWAPKAALWGVDPTEIFDD